MKRRLPSVKQLRYLVALEETRHFGRAAEHCFVSQSAFSTAIKELETTLEVQLVDRTNRSVTLTDSGRQFVIRARRLLQELEAMADAVRADGEPLSGSLKLGVIPTIAPFLLPPLMSHLKQHYPQLQLYIREEQTQRLYHELMRGELDLLLLALPWKLDQAQTEVLFQDRFCLAYRANSRHLKPEQYQPEELADGSVLLLEDGHCLRDHALAACRLGATAAINEFKASSLATLIQMVDEDLGVTYLPEMALASNLLEGTEIETLALGAAARDIGLAWRMGTAREQDFQLLGEVVEEIGKKIVPQ